jgi:hypothetical protein
MTFWQTPQQKVLAISQPWPSQAMFRRTVHRPPQEPPWRFMRCAPTLCVGKMAEAVKLYTEIGYPALCPAGRPRSSWDISRAMLAPPTHPHLEIRGRRRSPQALGRSVGQCRRVVFVGKFRPLVMTQHVKVMLPAPCGPHP